jgi:hypothetical protein
MAKELERSSAGEDDEVIRLAKMVLAETDPQGTAAGKYEVGSVGSIKADRGGVAAAIIHGDVSAGYRQPEDSPRGDER